LVLKNFTTILILGFLVLNIGCGQGFQAGVGDSLNPGSELSDVQCPSPKATSVSPFASQKVQVSSLTRAGFSKASVTDWKGSVDLLVDNACLQQSPQAKNFMGFDLSTMNPVGLKGLFAASMPMDLPPSFEALELAAASNPCVVGVSDPGEALKTEIKSAAVNDPQVNQQDHLPFLGFADSYQYFFEGNKLDASESIVVAVLDTGIDYTHPDLSCNINAATRGIDIVNGDNDPMDDDPGGHGTHVAGLVGACGNNGIGVTGVMPANIELMAVKVLRGDGGGPIPSVVNGILYAVENGADVINLSLAAAGEIPTLRAAIQTAINSGVVVVMAAGNDGLPISRDIPALQFSPAIDGDLAGAITVGSVDVVDGSRSAFSNYNSELIEIATTGSSDFVAFEGVFSTAPNGQYERISGTSQASPLVAGAVALTIASLKTRGIDYTPASVETYLLQNGTRVEQSLVRFFSEGRTLDLGVLAKNVAEQNGDTFSSTIPDLSGCP